MKIQRFYDSSIVRVAGIVAIFVTIVGALAAGADAIWPNLIDLPSETMTENQTDD